MARLPPCSQVIFAKEQKMALTTSRDKMASPRLESRWHGHFRSVQKMAFATFASRWHRHFKSQDGIATLLWFVLASPLSGFSVWPEQFDL